MTMMSNREPASVTKAVQARPFVASGGTMSVIREPKPKAEFVTGQEIPVGRLAVRKNTKLVFYRTNNTLACLNDVGKSFSGSIPGYDKEYRVLPVGTKVTLTQV